MTQKNFKDGNEYWVSNDYVIKIEFVNRKLCYKIKYTLNQKAKYIIF